MTLLPLLLAAASAFAQAPPVPAPVAVETPTDKAWAAFRRKDDRAAAALAREPAARGDADAQNLLGLLHSLGRGVPLDHAEARRLFEGAAAQKRATAKFHLGLLYHSGLGMEDSDMPKAVGLIQEAAKTGYPPAMYWMGTMLYDDPTNLDPAKAPLLPNVPANRFGIARDYEGARTLFSDSAGAFPPAAYKLGLMLLEGDGGPADPRAGADSILKAAHAGYPPAQYQAGVLYRDGLGVKADPAESLRWLRDAALGGDMWAMAELSRHYASLPSPSQDDLREAARWTRLAQFAGADAMDPGGRAAREAMRHFGWPMTYRVVDTAAMQKRRMDLLAKLGQDALLKAESRAEKDWEAVQALRLSQALPR